MLASLDELKGRLGIPADDTTQDSDLLIALGAASQKVLDLCAYVEDDTRLVETLRDAQQDAELALERRPVKVDTDANTFVVEGRSHGLDFITLDGDLIDPDKGVFVPLGMLWPPLLHDRYARDWHWPVLRVTYTAQGVGSEEDAPEPLRNAAIALAIYWHSQSQAGARKQVQAGPLMQITDDAPIPKGIRAMLSSHLREERGQWV